jgi:hypothetical protein
VNGVVATVVEVSEGMAVDQDGCFLVAIMPPGAGQPLETRAFVFLRISYSSIFINMLDNLSLGSIAVETLIWSSTRPLVKVLLMLGTFACVQDHGS